jgi:hypothetical protein
VRAISASFLFLNLAVETLLVFRELPAAISSASAATRQNSVIMRRFQAFKETVVYELFEEWPNA